MRKTRVVNKVIITRQWRHHTGASPRTFTPELGRLKDLLRVSMHVTYGENGNVLTTIKPLTIVRGHKRAIRERITDEVFQEDTGRQNGTSLQHHLSRGSKILKPDYVSNRLECSVFQ